jgi:hypothetical protein
MITKPVPSARNPHDSDSRQLFVRQRRIVRVRFRGGCDLSIIASRRAKSAAVIFGGLFGSSVKRTVVMQSGLLGVAAARGNNTGGTKSCPVIAV